jgi:alpha-glucosidase (family GH31 glycosyl hydrolase)
MTDALHQMGFRVTTWSHPFANVDSTTFLQGAKRGLWLKDAGGTAPGLVDWWQGTAAVIDPTDKEAVNWFMQIHREFKERYAIDSFKFDAGEISYTPPFFVTKEKQTNVNEFTQSYAEMVASMGPLVELRSAYRSQRHPVFVRMLDKFSTWGLDNGLQTVIPTALMMSTIGYAFILPDMIGGNGYSENEFSFETKLPSKELFIRWTQLNAFLPAMQFSIAPWQLDQEVIDICREFVKIHEDEVTPVILRAADDVINTGEA